MAEQFIAVNATPKLVKNFVKTVKCTITQVFHTNVGWNPASRGQYDAMMGVAGAGAIVGRAGLPPHCYIELAANTEVPKKDDTDLVRNLSRGALPTVLKALDPDTVPLWNQGHAWEALRKELAKGNVSIALYHFNGQEITAAQRDIINGYPKAA